ncbi:MAG: S41 family peptidase [Anaerolineales bacterium]|nr:MAG: S41 family peptidase [Anaerolineales bacterium]
MNNRRVVRILLILFILPIFLGVGFSGGILVDHFLIGPTVASAQTQTQSNSLDLINQAYQIIQKNYVDHSALQTTQLEYGAISGMVDALGDTGHSRFMTPEMVKSENNFTQGSFEGIGAEVTQNSNGQTVIVAPFDGSPAKAAGVKPGDIIVKVDGTDVSGMSLSDVVSKVLGPAGSKVTLSLQDPSTGATRDVTITRAKITVKNVTWIMLPGTTIADIRLAGFSQGVTADLQKALQQAQAQGATGIILDLRNNPGGLLSEAVGVTSQFLGSGIALLVKDAQGQEQPIAIKPGGVALNIPMVVLINQGTASAAEIVSGALQDAHRATIVGETTFGTGTVLNAFPLSDGSQILLATEEWLTPNGRVIWHKGIAPDVSVALANTVSPFLPEGAQGTTAAQLHNSQDAQLLKAIDLLSQGAN